MRHITRVTERGTTDLTVGDAVSPLRAFRGVLVCLSEGSPDDSMLHFACHATLGELECIDMAGLIDDTASTSAMLDYLFQTTQHQAGDLLQAHLTLHATLAALIHAHFTGD